MPATEHPGTSPAPKPPTADAAALVTSVGPKRSTREQMQSAGLEVIGSCRGLSRRPGLMDTSALLQDFSPAEADVLGEAMLLVRAQPGQLLIREDEASDWMMLLLSGTVDVFKRQIGGEVEVAQAEGSGSAPAGTTRIGVLREGALMGEMSMLDGEPRYASCSAITEVEAAVIGRDGVARLITAHPGVGAKLLVKMTQLLAQRLRNTSNQLVRVLQHRPS